MSDRPKGSSAVILRQRAALFQIIRLFFHERAVLEVDTPALSRYASIDRHLDPLLIAAGAGRAERYLITSPEYHMKRLICSGSGSIFQLCKAFRQDECGRRHNPEFTILEWYRVGWNHHRLMDEVDELLRGILGSSPAERLSYREVFRRYAGLDPLEMTMGAFLDCCRRNGLSPPGDLAESNGSADDRLDFLMGMVSEPRLGLQHPVFVYDYPATQAALARIHPQDPRLAERFEVFFKGMELGNGFHELTDAGEQRVRFENENRLRERAGGTDLPLDVDFLSALSQGLPDCAGIAMGFDRLLMLRLGLDRIDDAIAFSWGRA